MRRMRVVAWICLLAALVGGCKKKAGGKQVSDKEAETLLDERAELEAKNTRFKYLLARKEEIEQLQADARQSFPAEADVPGFFARLTQDAQLVGVSIPKWEARAEQQLGMFSRAPVYLELEGELQSLIALLVKLASGRLAMIESYQLTPISAPGDKPVRLHADVMLVLYVRPQQRGSGDDTVTVPESVDPSTHAAAILNEELRRDPFEGIPRARPETMPTVPGVGNCRPTAVPAPARPAAARRGGPPQRMSEAEVRKLQEEVATLRQQLKDFDVLDGAAEAAEHDALLLTTLKASRTPVYYLVELVRMTTQHELPTMTEQMRERAKTEPDLFLTTDWDPRHLVLTRVAEDNCRLAIWGVADTEQDVAELAKRLRTSVYFGRLAPVSSEKLPEGGVSFVFAGPPLR